jgi:GPH family glycoside/pentoside/hexuronide:cation symporter
VIYILANTTFATPLIGLGYEMTSDYNERTRLMGLANIVGQIAWMVVPWFWVLIADENLFATQAEGVRTLSSHCWCNSHRLWSLTCHILSWYRFQ